MAGASTAKGQARSSLEIEIEIAQPPDAENDELTTTLTNIVNAVYGETERDIFVDGYQRTNTDEVRQLIRAGELGVAYLKVVPTSSLTRQPIGCIRIQKFSDTLGEFGMFALDSTYQGTGVGRDMVLFVERYCKSIGMTDMQLELLFPTTFEHPFKMRLLAWYTRMGYKLIKLGIFQEYNPQLAHLLRGKCEYRVFQKALAEQGSSE